MKLQNVFATLFFIIATNFSFADDTPASTSVVKPIQEIKNEQLNFAELPKESQVGALAEYVKETDADIVPSLTASKKHKKKHEILRPYSEGLAYVNGELCHVGHYSQSIIYTVLEGPHYGMQTITALNGIVLYVNYYYELEFTNYGSVFHHQYSDSTVLTGSTQAIIFKK